MQRIVSSIRAFNNIVDHTISSAVESILLRHLSPVFVGLNQQSSTIKFPEFSISKDFSILLSRRKKHQRFSSEYINHEDKGFFNGPDRDLKQEKVLDYLAQCPRWLTSRIAKDWQPATERFYTGVILQLLIRKPVKPDSGMF